MPIVLVTKLYIMTDVETMLTLTAWLYVGGTNTCINYFAIQWRCDTQPKPFLEIVVEVGIWLWWVAEDIKLL